MFFTKFGTSIQAIADIIHQHLFTWMVATFKKMEIAIGYLIS